jgi:hypothetical protein
MSRVYKGKCVLHGHPVIVTVDDDDRVHAEIGSIPITPLPDSEAKSQEPIQVVCPSCMEMVQKLTGISP